MRGLLTLTTIQFHPIECALFRVRCVTAYGFGQAARCRPYVNLESLELKNTQQIYTSILNLRWLTSQQSPFACQATIKLFLYIVLSSAMCQESSGLILIKQAL